MNMQLAEKTLDRPAVGFRTAPSTQSWALGLGVWLAAAVTLSAAPQLTPVATGLNNPRGLAFGEEGTLFVAEAGLGAGDGLGGFGDGVGLTGSITEIKRLHSAHPKARRVVTGLVSLGTSERGPEVVGADGISLQGEGNLFVIMAESTAGVLAEDPGLDPGLASQFGQLLRLSPNGKRKNVADVGAVNYAWTAANAGQPWAPPEFPDSNPYAVLAVHGRQYVVDAGANTLSEVRPDGTVNIIAFFPNPLFPAVPGGPGVIPIADAVPTCVAQGPDGYLYVGTLAFGANFARFGGAPFWASLPKQSKIYRVNPKSSKFFVTEADVWADNLNPITGCGFSRGALYVTEFLTQESGYTTGDVVRIATKRNGQAGNRTALGVGALNAPNGFAADEDGDIYVSNNSTSAGVGPVTGEVVRVNY